MSFVTRSGRQTGRQQTQLTYHQSPRQQPNPAFQPQFQQAAVSHSLAQPAPPGATSPVHPQQIQPQPSQASPQPSPQLFKMQQQPTVTIKTEVGTPTRLSMPQASTVTPQGLSTHQIPVASQPQPQAGGTELEMAPDAVEVKPWKKQKNPTFKVNKVLKRRRLNARFRKLLIPKNAVMVLNELQPGVSFEAEEQTNAFSQLVYTVKINIDDATYTGEGSSKATAKAAAAEMAVKGLILKKMTEAGSKKTDGGNQGPAVEEEIDAASGDDVSEKGSINGKRVIPEDEVPWGSLASFALFKLFADWKAQGTNIPTCISAPLMAPKPIPKIAGPKPSTKGLMPENPETLHPVTLVGRLYPGTLFCEISREGNPPFLTFCIGATVNGVPYRGSAKSKKEAKKNCAIEILKANSVPYNANI